MRGVINIVKMDMAVCRKSMAIMTLSMLIAAICCLFFLTPLLLVFFVVGSTTVVSGIFSVEDKSNMEFFYGCFPIRKWEYIMGRSVTCFMVITIPSIICIAFILIGKHFSLCRIDEVRLIMEAIGQYQMIIACAMIMMGFLGGANLLLAAFVWKIESRELLEVMLLLLEILLGGIIVFFIQKIIYNGDMQKFLSDFYKLVSDHELISCILFITVGIIALIVGSMISLKIVQKKRI